MLSVWIVTSDTRQTITVVASSMSNAVTAAISAAAAKGGYLRECEIMAVERGMDIDGVGI